MLVKQHAFPTAACLLGKQALHPNWSCGIVYTDDKKIARTGRLRPRWDRTTPPLQRAAFWDLTSTMQAYHYAALQAVSLAPWVLPCPDPAAEAVLAGL